MKKKYKIPAYTYKGKAKNKYSKFFILNNKNKVCQKNCVSKNKYIINET